MNTSLLILAAGMGSRYGGMKQVDAFGPSGETITDYSIYDAIKAGFNRFVFVISPQMEDDFKNSYVKKFPDKLQIDYVIQSLEDLPGGYNLPAERLKPWGTAHAVLAAKDAIQEPFAVINADDFYGRKSYKIIHHFLTQVGEGDVHNQYCMVGFELQKTISEHGSVARGVCQVDAKGYLEGIVERTKIFRHGGKIVFEDEEGSRYPLAAMETVSMNLFGFTPDFFGHIEQNFIRFLESHLHHPKAELYIPYVVDNLIQSGTSKMTVLQTPESWFGVTYQEDKPKVLKAIQDLVDIGIYPKSLWAN